MTIQTPFTSTREPLAAAWGGEILDNLLSRSTVGRTAEGPVSPPRPPSFSRKTSPGSRLGNQCLWSGRSHCCHSKPGFTEAHWGKPKILGYLVGRWDLSPVWRTRLSTDGWTTLERTSGHPASCSQCPSPSPAFANLGCGSGWCTKCKDETGNVENYTLCVANSILDIAFSPPIQK